MMLLWVGVTLNNKAKTQQTNIKQTRLAVEQFDPGKRAVAVRHFNAGGRRHRTMRAICDHLFESVAVGDFAAGGMGS